MPLKGLSSTCIVETPEIVRAPVVVKVPVTLGNVEKSYTAVMVTGVAVEADAKGTEPIVKKASIHSVTAAERILVCGILKIFCLMWHFIFWLFWHSLALDH